MTGSGRSILAIYTLSANFKNLLHRQCLILMTLYGPLSDSVRLLQTASEFFCCISSFVVSYLAFMVLWMTLSDSFRLRIRVLLLHFFICGFISGLYGPLGDSVRLLQTSHQSSSVAFLHLWFHIWLLFCHYSSQGLHCLHNSQIQMKHCAKYISVT